MLKKLLQNQQNLKAGGIYSYTGIYFFKLALLVKYPIKEADNMRPLKEKVSITLDSDVVQSIKELAEADDRSFSQYINMILKEHVQPQDSTNEEK